MLTAVGKGPSWERYHPQLAGLSYRDYLSIPALVMKTNQRLFRPIFPYQFLSCSIIASPLIDQNHQGIVSKRYIPLTTFRGLRSHMLTNTQEPVPLLLSHNSGHVWTVLSTA